MNVLPGVSGEFTLLDGHAIKHTSGWAPTASAATSGAACCTDADLAGRRLFVAVVALLLGGWRDLCAGYLRWLDGVLMRVMDG
jgi:hypothetical protein